MNIPNKEELDTPNKLGRLYIQKHYPEFYEHLLKVYIGKTSSDKLSEKLYLYYNELDQSPRCPICNNIVPFLGFFDKGYQKYCSLKCSNNSPEVINKKEQTNIQKYGVSHPCQNEQIKSKLIETTIRNNGGMGNASITTKEKQQNSMLVKFGIMLLYI